MRPNQPARRADLSATSLQIRIHDVRAIRSTILIRSVPVRKMHPEVRQKWLQKSEKAAIYFFQNVG